MIFDYLSVVKLDPQLTLKFWQTRATKVSRLCHPHSRTPKRKPKGVCLSEADKLHNRELARVRVVCEHVIGKLKVFKILAERYPIVADVLACALISLLLSTTLNFLSLPFDSCKSLDERNSSLGMKIRITADNRGWSDLGAISLSKSLTEIPTSTPNYRSCECRKHGSQILLLGYHCQPRSSSGGGYGSGLCTVCGTGCT